MSFLDNIKAIPITDYATKCGFTLVRKGQRYCSLREHDSVMIDTTKNCFWRNSVFQKGNKGGAGSVIDFAMEFMGYEQSTALRNLAILYGVSSDISPTKQSLSIATSPVDFRKRKDGNLKLPPMGSDMKTVFDYLIKERGIDISVVRYFVAKKMLYQDAIHRNCVFVSHRFACVRSTGGKAFRGDVSGCDYNECFFHRPSREARSLVVAESVIDVMSIMTQFMREGRRYTQYSYLGLAGTPKLPSLYYHIEKESDIDTVLLAFDNDDAGRNAQDLACAELERRNFTGTVEIYTAPYGKDWNDYILKTAVNPTLAKISKEISR